MKYLNEYHKERSQKAMQFVEQSKNLPPMTHEEVVEHLRQRREKAGIKLLNLDGLKKWS